MALFHHLCVNLQDSLCGVPSYAFAKYLDFLDLTKDCSFLIWKLPSAYFLSVYGWALTNVWRPPVASTIPGEANQR